MSKFTNWDQLDFWGGVQWLAIQRKLDELEKRGISYNPDRVNLFRALDITPFDTCKVAIFGQDPYPQSKFATGIAFSIPAATTAWPRSLLEIILECQHDLRIRTPRNGNLESWSAQGVLLWNVVPTCETGRSLSHYSWDWNWLTKEIIERLSAKVQGCVLVFLGAVPREYEQYASDRSCHIISIGHPVAWTYKNYKGSHHPFKGSRIFSSINCCLTSLSYDPIDWRLS